MTMPVATTYDAAKFDDNFPLGIEHHFWFRARNAILDRALRMANRRDLIPPSPTILEVGCGTGLVVAGLRAKGHDIRGVELGSPPRSLVPDHVVTGVRAQDLEPGLRERVDALMFLDVIEHVPDDVELLRSTLAAFPRCRCVFVTVPARPELWSSHDTYYGHYRRYTPESLGRSLREAGLQPVETRYMFRTLYAAATLMTLTGIDRDPVMKAPRQRAVHGLLAAGLMLEDKLVGRLPMPGLSLLGVATVTSAQA